MKPNVGTAQRGESTLLDMMAIVLAACVVAAVVLVPLLARSRARGCRIKCINNLKQIGLSFRVWSGDNGGKYPMQLSTNLGGTMEIVPNGLVTPHFAVLSNELSTPKVLVCPEDSQRGFGTDFGRGLRDTNLSFFVVPEADAVLPMLWLSGDRNLAAFGAPLNPGLFVFRANQLMSWTTAQHNDRGNLCLADGSVQQVPSVRLQQAATNALRRYAAATTRTSFRVTIP